ncbi:MAG: sugar transferase [Lachnospiraceae bacterium]|nr:sugar transferase [Lachnospiraceae bacterium]MDE6984789.1 sugar transferase [Lachnospiraceae bacterium]MDE7028446.1 sugar transferase [Lachnospiraceae bacterium]
MYANYIKRLLDIGISFTALVVLSPVLLAVAVLVRIKLGAPVIFHQDRPGYQEKIFKLCKFRSMTDARGADGKLLPDEERLTRFGKALRASSLDELPELWNILKGDMSLIGPRPLLVSYLPYYTDEERLRHSVRPGLTGLAQVRGRNLLDWDRRFATDVEYVRNLTFAMDVKIFFMTIRKVFVREDIEVDTSQAEGNFAEIRKARQEKE